MARANRKQFARNETNYSAHSNKQKRADSRYHQHDRRNQTVCVMQWIWSGERMYEPKREILWVVFLSLLYIPLSACAQTAGPQEIGVADYFNNGSPAGLNQPAMVSDCSSCVPAPSECCVPRKRFSFRPSDHCFDDFISPMINFVFFEDPRNLTELRPIFVNHWVPATVGNGISADGSVQLYAAQFRIALTDRLSLIAVKDGFIVDETRGTLGGLLSDGWADVTAGLKYNVLRDVQRGRLMSIGATYEIPLGDDEALQSIGDGEFHFFATGGTRLGGCNAHYLSSLGYRVAADGDLQTSAIHWSNHLDFRLNQTAYLFTELAWWHWVDDAAAGAPLGIGGHDLFNLSANDVTGNDLVTQNVGVKLKPRRNREMGLAYEFPLTAFKDVTDGRLQAELILRY